LGWRPCHSDARRNPARRTSNPGLSREKVLAAVIRLLETTLIRVGNKEYADDKSYGLTTLRNRHVGVNGTTIQFEFRGKGGKKREVSIRDRRVTSIVGRLQEIPGQELFQYVDEDGARRPVGSANVNAYLREITGQEFSAKDFRTWTATVLAMLALRDCGPASNAARKSRTSPGQWKRWPAASATRPRYRASPTSTLTCFSTTAAARSLPSSTGCEGAAGDGPAGLAPEEAAALALLRAVDLDEPSRLVESARR
jgi:DNA topoisomerase-1